MGKIRGTIISSIFFITLFLPLLALADVDPLQEIKGEARTLNQLPSTKPEEVIGLGIKALMMFMGAIMFLLMVYAGTMWMTANGNADKISSAKNIIVWAALGTTVMLTSYIVINFVFGQLSQ